MLGAFLGGVIGLVCDFAIGWKWELGFRRIVLPIVIVFCATVVGVGLVVEWALGANRFASAAIALLAFGIASLGLLARRFYSDPERESPREEGAVLSPADGTVIYVKSYPPGAAPASNKRSRRFVIEEIADSSLASSGPVVIGIAMNYLDVHVNRAPHSGRVQLIRRRAGGFASLKRPRAVLENERVTTVIDAGPFEIAVVQIASRLVRRIVSFLKEGDDVESGQRIGMIRFGSQVDLVLPSRPDLVPSVVVGEHVLAGVTVVARPPRSSGPQR